MLKSDTGDKLGSGGLGVVQQQDLSTAGKAQHGYWANMDTMVVNLSGQHASGGGGGAGRPLVSS